MASTKAIRLAPMGEEMPAEPFLTASLNPEPDSTAPDGTAIRLLPRTEAGSMAHGTLPPGTVSRAIRHATVDEIWFVLAGAAEMWRMNEVAQSTVTIAANDSITIPVGTNFQFRTVGDEPFVFVMATMPPWSDASEAEFVTGRWQATNGDHS